MKRRKLSRREAIKGSAALGLCAFCFPPQGRCARACRDHAATDRCRQARRQGRALFRHGPAGGRKARQCVPGAISRRRGADRAFRLGAAVSADRAGIFVQHPRRRRHHARPTPLMSSRGSATAGWRLSSPKMSRNIFRTSTATPTASLRPRASGCRRSPTTPTSSNRPMRRRASPTCSIPDGPARW